MNVHQITAAMDGLNNHIGELEGRLEDMRRVLTILLERVPLESQEKDELLSILEVEVAKAPEKSPERLEPRRSIQELLDESQETPKRPK